MTVNEALAVCKVLARRGYGNYKLTNDCGYNEMTCYPDLIKDDDKVINMEGSVVDKHDNRGCLQIICAEITEALKGADDNA